MKKLIIILFAVSFGIAPAMSSLLAQPGAFSRMGFSPRGMAMGNTMTAVNHEGSYGYYNPAMAAMSSGSIQVDLSTAALQFDRQLHMFTAHFQLPPMAGFSLSLINARVSNIDGRSQSGYHTEYLSTAEYQLFGNFGLRFSDSVWAGIGIKYNLADFHEEISSSSNIGIDLGIRTAITSQLTAAIAIKDLLTENDIDTANLYTTDSATDSAQPYPVRVLAGLAYEFNNEWLLSLDIEQRFHQSKLVRTVTVQNNGFDQTRVVRDDVSYGSQYIRVGNRYHLHERFTIRGGFQLHNISAETRFLPSGGFSLHLPFDSLSPSIDYAFMREPNRISNMHVFSLRLNI